MQFRAKESQEKKTRVEEPLGCVAADWSERLLRMRYKSEALSSKLQ